MRRASQDDLQRCAVRRLLRRRAALGSDLDVSEAEERRSHTFGAATRRSASWMSSLSEPLPTWAGAASISERVLIDVRHTEEAVSFRIDC